MLLGDERVRPRAHPRDQRCAFLGTEVAPEQSSPALVGKRRLDHQPLEIADHLIESGALAADSSTPVPSAFETATLPARIARSSPGTPSAESPRNSTGSQKSSSRRR